MDTPVKPPSPYVLASRAQYRAEAALHRALAPHAPSPEAAAAHLALATAWEEKAKVSEARETAPAPKKPTIPGYHAWGPLQDATAAETRGVSKRVAKALSAGVVRCACGLARSVEGPQRYKLPGKPWVAVRPPCPLTSTKVPGT